MKTFMCAVVLLVATSAAALTPATEIVAPAEAWSGGSGGSMWQVDLLLLNPGSTSSAGQLTGGSTNVPNPSIDSVQYEGTITPTTYSVNYTITFSNGGGIAAGVVSLTKQ
jgi:hypothetical protein